MAETITGFSSTEVIRTLIGSIIQGDRTGSQRWTAELLCSEKGYPKLLSIYVFIGFRYFLPASYSWVPHIRQKIRLLEDRWRSSGASTRTFRNSTEVRSSCRMDRNLVSATTETITKTSHKKRGFHCCCTT
jgi:hypothetical protein